MTGDDKPTPLGEFLIAKMKGHRPEIDRVELAERVGVSPSSISRWIMQPIRPTTEALKRAADVLECDYDELLEVAGHPRRSQQAIPLPADFVPLAAEIHRMLGPDSTLTDTEKTGVRTAVDAVIAPYRGLMRRSRRAS